MPIMIRTLSDAFARMSGMPINSKGGRNLLKQAGIDVHNKQYQAALRQMSAGVGAGIAYTNPDGIRNLMRRFDADGNLLNPHGIAGMDATNKVPGSWHKIIDVDEEHRQAMFDNAKREFLQGKGVADGNSRRSEVFADYQRSVAKDERLSGSWTLGQYENQYNKAFYDAAKAADPGWRPGKPIPLGALDGITRESIDQSLVKTQGEYGETFTRGVDMTV